MARFKNDRVALSVGEEQIVIDVLLHLYKEGQWDYACNRVATSFLEWLIIYRDSLEKVFDKASRGGFTFPRFPTHNPDGWRETATGIKKMSPANATLAKNEHRKKVLKRRSRKILETAKKLDIPKEDVHALFQHLHQEPERGSSSNQDVLMKFMTEELLRMDEELKALKAIVQGLVK